MPLKLMYITNDAEIALIAENAGVDRIWIDLETLGKEERQANMNTVKSRHCVDDIRKIKPLLSKSVMLVRVNPINAGSAAEINEVINAGADIVMLPMWKTTAEVSDFIGMVGRRARVCLLLETKEAENCIDEVLKLEGIDEIHIGLNDLHLSRHMTFMFELLADGTVEKLCGKIKQKDIPYGFGGIAQLDDGMLPARYIIAEHFRLGSSMAILSRSFCSVPEDYDPAAVKKEFTEGVRKIREFESCLPEKPQSFFVSNRAQVKKNLRPKSRV